MLSLHNIKKSYLSGDNTVEALRGVSIDFREHEFVSILGPSGCGKTTLLNVIGGLDRYDSGDLIIGGRSTKSFKDADWDTYRNHSIGFVFQSYNLIMHQSVLSNVELALTLSGVSREERRRRAAEALEAVGLGDQLHKKPNQMSGGQMQRVAIARALVNDPEIILADEPTGALDTATSVQIMEILKSVSEKKLIIMVTHNPELAKAYSSRIIRVLDGRVIEDSDPYQAPADAPASLPETAEASVPDAAESPEKPRRTKKKKRSMSFFTALSLSLQNLLTKKTRSLLVSVAGSIGIIGIALILALSNGVQLYIAHVQEETLTSYPVSLSAQTTDYASMISAMVDTGRKENRHTEPNTVYVDDSISNLVSAMTNKQRNQLSKFNRYLLANYDKIKDQVNAVQYAYDMDLQIYNSTAEYGLVKVNPADILSKFSAYSPMVAGDMKLSIFSEIMPGKNGELINDAIYGQYDLLDGRWPEKAEELVLVVDRNHTVTNLTLYMLGMCDPNELSAIMMAMFTGSEYRPDTTDLSFSYQDFYDLTLNLVYNSDYFVKSAKPGYEVGGKSYPVWEDLRDRDDFNAGSLFSDGAELKIVGIISPNADSTARSITGSIGYTKALTEKVLGEVNGSEIVRQQLETASHDVFTGLPFRIEDAQTLSDAVKKEKLSSYFGTLDTEGKAEVYRKIKTAITPAQLSTMLGILNDTFPTVEEKQVFLVSLYGIAAGKGSLAEYLPDGVTRNPANKAAAAILSVLDGNKSVEEYQREVPAYEKMFGLDGVALVSGNATYENYLSLIKTMYPTDKKLESAFTSTSEDTIRRFYGLQKEQEIATAAAGRYADEIKARCMPGGSPDVAAMRAFITEHYQKESSLPESVIKDYVDSLPMMSADPDAETLFSVFGTVLGKESAEKASDKAYVTQCAAALFDELFSGLSDAEYASYYENYMEKSESTLDLNLAELGASDGRDALSTIYLYPTDFEAKEKIADFITEYNNTKEDEEEKIAYTDIMAVIMSSVTTIVNAISYVLIAFVSISLVVSSIMIGIITYISVLERTKEIGILRAIGASKRDISRVFNAETLIIGFGAGVIGILFTLLLCLPINLIIHHLSGIGIINATLPVAAGFILVGISMALTLIAGLIPSRLASKKDPVEALRTE
ncbi:MAG: ABC transporter ATP-binding protein/permease [Eubacteriales bacterium]|nr:ABC transporter ATP-binding protein/permease [Eubacteriales bacterium]